MGGGVHFREVCGEESGEVKGQLLQGPFRFGSDDC